MIVGLGGARRNAGASLCRDEALVAACERERITRTRGQGMLDTGFPSETVEAVLEIAGSTIVDSVTFASAEGQIVTPGHSVHEQFPHHFGHAATAYYSSPYSDAFVLVCDRHGLPEVSLWRGRDGRLEPVFDSWEGPGFATLYGEAARAFGFVPDRDEHRLEAMARLSTGGNAVLPWSVGSLCENRLRLPDALGARLEEAAREARLAGTLADLAGRLQRQIAELVVKFLESRLPPHARVCLAGGLFYNTFFTTAVAESPHVTEVFVPVHPGNTGLAVGCALATAEVRAGGLKARPATPFLGPAFEAEPIKATLDNCKLSNEYAGDGSLVDRTVDALQAGHLVAWFQGAMEWGPRALGNRSILASPRSPYVLENLNRFLKRREVVRSYGVSACEEDADRYFEGPPRSAFMEFEFRVRDPELFRHVVPPGSERLRVHTVGPEPRLLRQLLKAFGQASGLPVLVNTSFNAFHEPIVCTPRDAVRVFYGTGLDMLVLGNFILRK